MTRGLRWYPLYTEIYLPLYLDVYCSTVFNIVRHGMYSIELGYIQFDIVTLHGDVMSNKTHLQFQTSIPCFTQDQYVFRSSALSLPLPLLLLVLLVHLHFLVPLTLLILLFSFSLLFTYFTIYYVLYVHVLSNPTFAVARNKHLFLFLSEKYKQPCHKAVRAFPQSTH